MRLSDLVGKAVFAVLGYKKRKNQKRIEPSVILFDDGETIMEIDEQDYIMYHDCSYQARELTIFADKKRWRDYNTSDWYGPANAEI